MTDETWLPADFVHPLHVELTAALHLRPIRASDVDIDLPVVLANQKELWAVYGQAWQWPPATLTREQDEADLARHADEMRAHLSFNYSVVDTDESTLLGCVYIDPLPTVDGRRGAEVSWWTDRRAGEPVRRTLDDFVPGWIRRRWPFDTVTFPFNPGSPVHPPTGRPLE